MRTSSSSRRLDLLKTRQMVKPSSVSSKRLDQSDSPGHPEVYRVIPPLNPGSSLTAAQVKCQGEVKVSSEDVQMNLTDIGLSHLYGISQVLVQTHTQKSRTSPTFLNLSLGKACAVIIAGC